jgi:hypothetical protein
MDFIWLQLRSNHLTTAREMRRITMNGTEHPEESRFQVPREKRDRSFGGLFKDLSRGAVTLVRQELEFAKEEMSQKVTRASRDSIQLIIGGGIALAGFLFVLGAIVIGLSMYMPIGISSLIVGLLVMGIGGIVIHQGRKKLKEEKLAPQKTIHSLKEDKEWMKEKMV